MSEKKSILKIFTNLGIKVRNVVAWSSFIFVILLILDLSYLQNKCELQQQANKPDIEFYCQSSKIISNIYESLLVSIITILFIELSLRKDNIEEIKEIFNSSQSTRYINAFYPNRDIYNRQIVTRIKALKEQEEVRLLGLAKDIHILNTVDSPTIQEKIEKGCKFKILLLYPSPDNLLMQCLQKSHRNLKYIEESIKGDFIFLRTIVDDLTIKSSIRGEIEVRLLKDIYSSICYFSTKDNRSSQDFMAFIWMYFFNSKGLEYPAFEILDKQLLNDAEQHFNHLWEKAYFLLKFNDTTKISHLNELFNSNNK